MKDKAIYIAIGMLLMYFSMIMLGFSRAIDDTITSKYIDSNVHASDVLVVSYSSDAKVQKKTLIDGDNMSQYIGTLGENALKNKRDHNTDMRSFRLKRLTSKLAQKLKFDPIKWKQITNLADLKMAREQELDKMVLVDMDDPNVQAQQQIMSRSELELTPEELNIKTASIENYTEYLELLEQARIEFEDELINVLNVQELQAFRVQETEIMNDKFERYVDAVGESAKLHLNDLNDFQVGQVDKIIIDYRSSVLDQAPIGSSISSNPVKVSGNAQPHISKLYDELSLVLSPEQMAQFKAAPIIFDLLL